MHMPFLVAVSATLLASSALAQEGTVNVYNWSDYIAEDTLANFTAETGIAVNYDVFDSNEIVEARLLAGSSGYDVVIPSGFFLERQIPIGLLTITRYGSNIIIPYVLAKYDDESRLWERRDGEVLGDHVP